MTNNLEDFEQPDAGQGGELPPAIGARAKLAHAWRTRPLFKLLVLMVVVGAVIAVGMSLFSSAPQTPLTKFINPPQMKEAPGGAASPYFLEQQKIADADREKHALQTGGSAIPTPVGQNAGMDEMNGNEKAKKDPLVELKGEIEHQNQQIQQMRQQQQVQQQQQQQPVAPKPPEQFDNSLAQAMQAQLKQLVGGWEPQKLKQVNGVALKGEEEGKNKKDAAGTGHSSSLADAQAATASQAKVIVPAGTVSYAQMLTEANSDVPGPILAQILSGPLTGARAIGSFEVMNEYLVIHFRNANLKGTDYQINVLALDPDTTLGGMATEVDERYITRVVLPAAASFMEGLGSALGQTPSAVVTNGTTTVVQQSSIGIQQGMFLGLGSAAKTVGQFFQSQANQTKPLIRVAAGTPMGFFFVSSVYNQNMSLPLGYGPNGQYPGVPPTAGTPGYGYGPGTGYGAYGQGYGYGGMPGSYNPGGGYGNPTSSAYPPASAGPYPPSNSPYNTTNSSYGSNGFGSNNYYSTTSGYGGNTQPIFNP